MISDVVVCLFLPPDCETGNLDMAFVMDASKSIIDQDFEKSKGFTAEVINGFNVGLDAVRVAVTSFSDDVHVS